MLETGKNIIEFIKSGGNSNQVINIPVNQITPSRYQPRLQFDEQALNDLAESIRNSGLIQPITVRKIDNHYEIIAGERRFRACQRIGYTQIPCYILSPNETEAAEMALVENIQREDLTAVEEAKSYVMIMRQSGLTQEQVAVKVGKSQSAVANKIRLLNLPEDVQQAVINKELSERHARALLSVPERQQIQVYHYIVEHQLNVRETEAYIEKMNIPRRTRKRRKTKGFTRSTQIGINSINQCVEMIKKMGIEVTTETKDNDGDVSVVIKFPK